MLNLSPKERRIHIAQSLSILYIPQYNALCEKLSLNWVPYSGFRTFEEQDDLYKQGRETGGPIVTNARGGQSAHNYASASDWTWMDDDGTIQWLNDDDPRWKEYLDAIESCGLYAGNNYGDIDHNNLKISIPWASLYPIVKQKGMPAAIQKIKDCIVSP